MFRVDRVPGRRILVGDGSSGRGQAARVRTIGSKRPTRERARYRLGLARVGKVNRRRIRFREVEDLLSSLSPLPFQGSERIFGGVAPVEAARESRRHWR